MYCVAYQGNGKDSRNRDKGIETLEPVLLGVEECLPRKKKRMSKERKKK